MAGHLQLIERELRDMLAKEDTDAVVKWVKERVLESYRNGLAAGGSKPSATDSRCGTKATRHKQR